MLSWKRKHLYEIICIDDGSQDKSPTILNKYSKIFFNLKIFKNYKNLGVGRSRNIGIENSNGKFIIFLDSDDKFIKKNLIKFLKYLKKSDEELIFINYLDDNKFTLNLNRNNVSKYNFLKEITKTQSLNYCFPYVYQRKFLLNNNIFFENFRYAEDFVFITKVFVLKNLKL